MSTRTKSILIYVGGIVTGIILTFAFFFFVALGNANGTPPDENVVLFEKPQQEINVKSFKVMQVLPDGSALATVNDTFDIDHIGMVVLFLADEGISYYDEQIINVPTGKRVMQIGTYKYITRSEMEKTVPIVEIME